MTKRNRTKIIAYMLVFQMICQFIFPSVERIYAQGEINGEHNFSEIPEGYTGIYSAEDLDKIRHNLSGKYVLMNEIDLTEVTSVGGAYDHNGSGWEPIGTQETPFTGTFDGNGYNIKGMKISINSENSVYAGLFGYSRHALIQNLSIDGQINGEVKNLHASSEISINVGAISGVIEETIIRNVSHSGEIIVKGTFDSSNYNVFESNIGGIVGTADSSSIVNSSNDGEISGSTYASRLNSSTYYTNSGGIVGKLTDSTIPGNSNIGNINAFTSAQYGNTYSGGIAGYITGGKGSTISDSKNSGNVLAKADSPSGANAYNAYAGGVVGRMSGGYMNDSMNRVKIINSSNSGNVNAESYLEFTAGGIAGEANLAFIQNTSNTGTVSGEETGGIAGFLQESIIETSYNDGQIKGDVVGGITGYAFYDTTITKSYNANNITATGDFAGGIVGKTMVNSTISHTFNIGAVYGKGVIGGIVGGANDANLNNSYNIGPLVGQADFFGGIAGRISNTTSYNNFYLDYISTNTEKIDGINAIDNKGLKQLSTLDDFTSIWTLEGNANYIYPELLNVPFQGEEQNNGMFVKTSPVKKEYLQGEGLDVTGAVVTVMTNYGKSFDVHVEPNMVSGYDPNQLGEQQVTITYEDVKTTLNITVIERDIVAPSKPTVNEVTDQSHSVTGMAEAGSKVEVIGSNSVIGTATARLEGIYFVTIPVQQSGTELTITAIDEAGNKSEPAKVIVKDTIAPAKPIVHEVTDQDTTVTGEAEAGSRIEIRMNTSVTGSARVDENGEFTVSIPKQAAGTNLIVNATDAAGNISEATKVVVQDITAPVKPNVMEVTDRDKIVSGNAEAGAKVEIRMNSTLIGSGTVDANGQFTVEIPIQKAGTELTVTTLDGANLTSEVVKVIIKDATPPNKPIVQKVTNSDTVVQGNAEPGSKLEVSVDKTIIGAGTAEESGDFKVAIFKQKSGTELVVTSIDQTGNRSETTKVIVGESAKAIAWPEGADLSVLTKTDTTITLSWKEAAALNGVEKYHVYQDGELIKSLPSTVKEFQITGLTANKTYHLSIVAESLDKAKTDALTVEVKTKEGELTIPTIDLPTKHDFPIARLHIRKSGVPMVKKEQDGSYTVFKYFNRGEFLRTYGVDGQYYNVGGSYYIKHDSNSVAIYIGRALVEANTPLYAPDGSINRMVMKGEAIRVYNYTSTRFEVGGGYYMKNDNKTKYYVGMMSLKDKTVLYAPDGSAHSTLQKGKQYRVYSIDGNHINVGGGYYVLGDEKKVNYMKN